MSPPYHQASNGLGERAVQTVKILMSTLDVEFEEKLFRIQKEYNGLVNPSLGYAPFEVARGRNLPFMSEFIPVRGQVRKVDIDWKVFGERVFRNKERSNEGRRSAERKNLKAGDVVWVFDARRKTWNGPVKIVEVEGQGRVVLVEKYGRISEDHVKKMAVSQILETMKF